ncbi:MAG TPA: DUF1214 domain-containing protein [Acidimicrobiales bacterium]|nr:DUF1214 domain-containing protein [Acidimicrobiales bacterium]
MATPSDPGRPSLRDAYVYLLGRALVARQQATDLAEPGAAFNQLKHNPVATPLEWVNPNLDVTNTEAWIGVDEDTPALLEVPRVDGRYFTVQICDEWGEVITNINERNYPEHRHGTFALVAPGSRAAVPDGAVRIELRSPKAKLLARIELGSDRDGAVELQHQISLRSSGSPRVPAPVELPPFDNADLIGVELFEHAEALLTSAPDVSPVAAQFQAKVRDVVASIEDPEERTRTDEALRSTVVPEFQRYAVQEAGAVGGNWLATTVIGNYGDDIAIRTAANYVGIWANSRHEVVYFVTTRDADGNPLDGSLTYVLDFPAASHPDRVVDAYWSLSLVDVPRFVAVENRLDRYTFNSVNPPPANPDGGMQIFVAPDARGTIAEANWLPAAEGRPFSLTFRAYVPREIVKQGEWFPPAPRKV